MTALEEEIFTEFLSDPTMVAKKTVIDIGCGTGRHWPRMLSCGPRLLHGVDISAEMLARLRARYPTAALHVRTGIRLDEFADASVDLVLSSLMLGYERDVRDELREWKRLLSPRGEIIVTDFHPAALQAGAKRTFRHRGGTFEIQNHVHTLDTLRSSFKLLNLEVVQFQERMFDGSPVVFGFHLRRSD